VLETVRKEEKKPKRLGSMQPNFNSVWHTGLSGGAPDSVRCARRVSGESAALGNRRRRTAKNHRTVRWCTGLSGEPTVASANGRSCNLRATRGLLQRSVGAPDNVRFANQPRGATVGYAKFGRRSRTGQSIGPVRWCTGLSGAPLDRRQG
jgi:adenylylsulfate kinase-like enzyme